LRVLNDNFRFFSRTTTEETKDFRQYETQSKEKNNEKWKMVHGMSLVAASFLEFQRKA